MKLKESFRRLQAGLLKPSAWEREEGFRSTVDELCRRGLLTAGVLALLAVALYLSVNLGLLGKEAVLYFPQPAATKEFVVLWDKLLVAGVGVVMITMYRLRAPASTGRWVGVAIAVIVSAASVFDDVQGGDVSFSPAYPTLFMLVAVGALMLRPLQTFFMTIAVAIVVFFGESAFALPGVHSAGIVPEQLPFMFIASVVLTGISLLLYTTRYEQYLARTQAERLKQQVAGYASDLEVRARELQNEKTRAEEHARALEVEQALTMEQAQKLADAERLKDRFFANISHEFRTPLTLIMGPVQDALDGEYGELPVDFSNQLTIVESSSQRLLHLVNDLLDLSKLDAGAVRLRPKSTDVVAFLAPIVGTFADLAKRRGIALTFETDAESLEANFDPDAIEKVVYNLLSNALKFTPEGGSVRIRLFVQEDDDHENVCIAVRDTGPGISAAEIEKIFDRFHQSDQEDSYAFEGTGLGLALARELVELHGGEVRVESEVGFGSEFSVRWPSGHRFAEPSSSRAGRVHPVDQRHDENITESQDEEGVASASAPIILVVDNDVDVRGYIRNRLKETYRVVEAEDGADALSQIKSERPDLVICDVMMPRMDGIEFCRHLRKDPELSDIPVVLLTARADDESRIEGLKAGADDYMSKPFSARELLARVENLIEIRRLVRTQPISDAAIPSPVDVPSLDQVFLDRVREIVEDHIGDSNFGVDWLADEVALSSRQLQRKMKNIAGLSAAGFIRLMRLRRAAQLLKRRTGNVTEVAYAVGFRDAAHFSKIFKQTFGMLPSEVAADGDVDLSS